MSRLESTVACVVICSIALFPACATAQTINLAGADNVIQGVTLQGGVTKSQQIRNNKVFEFEKDKDGRILSGKRVGGIRVDYKYKNANSEEIIAVKIGNRKWVDTSAANVKSSCAASGQAIPSSSETRDLSSMLNSGGIAQFSPASPQLKFGGDDAITQSDLDDINDMYAAMSYDLMSEFSSQRDRCIATCGRLGRLGATTCIALAYFSAGVAAPPCLLSVALHQLACEFMCDY